MRSRRPSWRVAPLTVASLPVAPAGGHADSGTDAEAGVVVALPVPCRAMTRRTSALLITAVSALALVGCSASVSVGGKTLDRDDLHALIEDQLAGDLPVTIADADCPEVEDPADGDTFECTATLDGQPVTVVGTVTDAENGTVNVVFGDAVLDVAALESTTAEQLGEGITVECGDENYLVQEVGASFECEATDSSGATAAVAVTVNDVAGNVSFEVVEG